MLMPKSVVSPTKKKLSPAYKRHLRRVRARRAYNLRRKGMTWREVGSVLGVGPARASQLGWQHERTERRGSRAFKAWLRKAQRETAKRVAAAKAEKALWENEPKEHVRAFKRFAYYNFWNYPGRWPIEFAPNGVKPE